MHLKLRHLAVFHAVMEEGSVSKAAARLGLSQPAVSIALTRLEEMMGYPLFNRSKGYFAPLPEARALHADAEVAILAFERFASHAQLIGKGSAGLVRVGAIGATALSFLPDVIARFSRERRSVEVQLQVRSSAQIVHLVGNSQIDIGIVEAPVAAQSIRSMALSVPCVCILRADDPLAELPALTPVHLRGRQMISVNEDHALDRQIRAAFVAAEVPWDTQIRCYFFAIMRDLVAKGAGIAIVDAMNGCKPADDGVVWRPFQPALRYDLALITRAEAGLQAPAQEFLDMAATELRRFSTTLTGDGPTQ